jgi:hypothetical protein
VRKRDLRAKRETHWATVDREVVTRIKLALAQSPAQGACRLLAEGVDLRAIRLMLGHADLKQTQRYLNVTDEELRRVMAAMSERRRGTKGGERAARPRRRTVSRMSPEDREAAGARQDSNLPMSLYRLWV